MNMAFEESRDHIELGTPKNSGTADVDLIQGDFETDSASTDDYLETNSDLDHSCLLWGCVCRGGVCTFHLCVRPRSLADLPCRKLFFSS